MCFTPPCPADGSEGSPPGPDRVLEALRLPPQALVNVVMHLDLVPKAFVCDFTAAVGVGLGFGCYCWDVCGRGGVEVRRVGYPPTPRTKLNPPSSHTHMHAQAGALKRLLPSLRGLRSLSVGRSEPGRRYIYTHLGATAVLKWVKHAPVPGSYQHTYNDITTPKYEFHTCIP